MLILSHAVFLCLYASSAYSARIEFLNAVTQIQARFATTLVSSKVRNEDSKDVEVAFTAQLPDEAFITNFTMLINDKIIIGDVKEKEEAKRVYEEAKSRGESAGHVLQKPRETSTFQIQTNLAGKSSVIFNLTYQEMLKRVHGVYRHVINLQPDMTPEKVQIDVFITERGQIRNLKVPKFGPRVSDMTNRELLQQDDEPNVKFKKNIGGKLSNVQVSLTPNDNGQLVVLYDVVRDKSAGDIEVINGYFVHFIAPDGITPGNKHVIFVLDRSGSMEGRKIEQLKEAMTSILGDLNPEDKFNIVMFSSDVEKWKPESVAATSTEKDAAKQHIKSQSASGSTALNDALVQSLQMLHAAAKPSSKTLLSMLVFMTDGLPTDGETNADRIVTNVFRANPSNFTIHCMGFGNDVDYGLLKRIAGRQNGLARKIYEDSDAAMQITGFFDEISSPLLTDLKIDYLNETIDVNSLVFADKNYYQGGETVVVGKLKDDSVKRVEQANLVAKVSGTSAAGPITLEARSVGWICPMYNGADWVSRPFWRCCPPMYEPMALSRSKRMIPCCWPNCCWGWYDRCPPWPPVPPLPIITPSPKPILPAETAGGFVDRMWAYRTIQKLLRQIDSNEGDIESLKKKSLDMSLRYHFVTPLTSMVVVDPSQNTRSSLEKNTEKVQTARAGSNSASAGSNTGGKNSGPISPGSSGSFGRGEASGPVPVDEENGKQAGESRGSAAVLTTRIAAFFTTTSSAKRTSGTTCAVYATFVLDAINGTASLVDIGSLFNKIIDQLSNKLRQNTYVTVILSDQLGRAFTSKSKINILSDPASLKNSIRITPIKYDKALNESLESGLSKYAYDSHIIVFFSGSDSSAEKSEQAVNSLRKKTGAASLRLKILVVSMDGELSAHERSLSGKSLANLFVNPDPADIVQAIAC